MSKPIRNYFELKNVLHQVSKGYAGTFMIVYLEHLEMWKNPKRKDEFIRFMNKEYGCIDDLKEKRKKVNAMIRIIESHMVEDAMQLVLEANAFKFKNEYAKPQAQKVLDCLESGELKY